MTRASRKVLWLVFGAVAAVFLVVCVNVIGLLLAHAEDRKRELAVRAAIGADRATLARQLLVEAALLAIVGALAGWFLSAAVFRVIVNQIPQWLQLLGEPRLDGRAAALAGLLALLTIVIAGVIPVFRASREMPRAALAASARQASSAPRGRHTLIFVEVALATLLLCAGSVMLRSWMTLHAQETGMQADRVIAVRAVPAGVADASRRAVHNSIVADAMRRVPGAGSLAFVDMPLVQRAVRGSQFIPPAQVLHPPAPTPT